MKKRLDYCMIGYITCSPVQRIMLSTSTDGYKNRIRTILRRGMLIRTRKVQNGGVEKGLVFTALTAQVRMQVMLISECYLEYEELRPFEKLKFIHP